MMTNKQTATQTRVETSTTLTSSEEKVVRMRHGLRAPDTLALERHGEGDPVVAAEVAEIEKRVLGAAGVRNNSTKRKIIGALRHKNR